MILRAAHARDAEWIAPLYRQHRDLAGAWYWSWRRRGESQQTWLVAEQSADGPSLGVVHFYYSDTRACWVVAEIVVAPLAKRSGVGRALLSAVPMPVELKTNEDNPESHGFYQALGFREIGRTTTRRGKPMVIYRKEAPCAAS